MLGTFGLILAAIASVVYAQNGKNGGSCFDREVKSSQYVYYGDTPSYDLGLLASGPALEFKLNNSYSGAEIQPTFSKYENIVPLMNQTAQKCTAYVHIEGENYAYLCDNSMVVFATYDSITGKLVANSSTAFDVPANSECSTLAASAPRREVYFSCLLPVDPESGNRTLITYLADSTNSSIKGSVSAITDPKQGILKNLVLTAYTQTIQGLTSVILYLYEGNEGTGMKFHLFKVTPQARLADGGYFSLGTGNLAGVNDTTNFFQFEVMEDYVFSVARNSKTLNIFIQKCLPSPVYDKFTCTDEVKNFDIQDPDVHLTVHRPMDRNVDNYWRLAVATTKKISIYNVDPSVVPVNAFLYREGDISLSTITQITDVFTWNERVFLVGKTSDNSNSILLYRFNVPNYEQRIFQGSSSFEVSFVRRGTYDNDVDEHIGVSQGDTFTSFVYIAQLVMNLNESPRNVIATVDCYSGGNYVNSFSINFTVLQNVSGDANIVLPKTLEAFVGSHAITVPSSAYSFQGNAPNPSVTTNFPGMIAAKIQYARETDLVDYRGKSVDYINEFQYIGDDLFMASSEKALSLISFSASAWDDSFYPETGFGFELLRLDFSRMQYLLGAAVRGEYVLILIANGLKGLPQPTDSFTALLYNVKGLAALEKNVTFPNYSSAVSVIRVSGSTFDCFFAGYDPTSLTTPKLMLLSITIGQAIDKPVSFLNLPEVICPVDMFFSPNGGNKLFLASSCGTNTTARVYTFTIQRSQLNTSSNGKTYIISSTTRFSICPTTRELNIIDFQNKIVFSFDMKGSEDYRIMYPFTEYGLNTIIDYNCDPENEIFQVLGSDPETGKTRLVTYRAESINQPNTRVHSVRPVSAESRFLASSYNYENLQIYSVVLENSLDREDDEPFTFFRLYTGAPVFSLNASKTTQEADIQVTYVGLFDSAKPAQVVFINTTQTLTLKHMPNTLKVSMNNNKLTVPNGPTTINLDNLLQITGGHVVDVQLTPSTNNDVVAIVDRFSPSSQFNNVTYELEQSIMDQNFIFGFKNGELILLEEGQTVITVKVGRLISMDSAGDGTAFYALTLTNPSEGVLNSIYAFLFVGDQWRVIKHTLSGGTYADMRFFKISITQFGYAAWRESKHQIEVATLRVDLGSENALITSQSSLNLYNSILDFSLAHLKNDAYLLIISTEIESETSNFDLFKLETDSNNNYTRLFFQTRQEMGLVPGITSVPSEVEYDCVVNHLKNLTVDCLHAEPNMYSYYVSYSISPADIPTKQFITPTLNKKLVNIVNTKPVRVRMGLNYSAITVKVIDFDSGALARGKYFLAIYAFNYQDTFFRMLKNTDLGFDDKTSLEDLDPCFFKQAGTNGTKLGVNLGKCSSGNSTVKVFNIDGLRLVVNKPQDLDSESSIRFYSLQSSTTDLGLDSIFEGLSPDQKKAKSHRTLFIILGVVALLLVIILGVAYKLTRGTSGDSYIQESGLQDTRLDAENTMKIGGADSSNLPA